MNGSTGELLARRRAVSGRAPIAALVDRLCATTTTEAATPIRHGAGRLVVVGGGIGSGRTTALVDAAETCWALGVTAHLILAGEPARPGLLDEILAMPSSEPVLLAVDDADVHHPELLERIVASADALRLRRVLVLAVVRGGELVELPQRISTSGLLERVTERIDLQPFGTAELATLASIAFAAESEGQVAAATDTPVAARSLRRSSPSSPVRRVGSLASSTRRSRISLRVSRMRRASGPWCPIPPAACGVSRTRCWRASEHLAWRHSPARP